MRAPLSWMLAFGLALTPAIASAAKPGDTNKDNSAAAKSSDATANKEKAADTSAAKTDSKAEPAAKPGTTAVENELQQMRELLEAQSKQIQLQNDQLRLQQAKMDAMESSIESAKAAGLTAPAGGVALAGKPAAADPELYFSGADEKNPDEPLSIHYKGITITPGGFLAAETVYRNRALSADVNTPFTSVPFSFSDQSKIGEFNASGRQSRITLLGEGKLGSMTIRGYYETDWLSSGTSSNNNQSNSYTNRQRQLWAQAALDNGWTFTGGQMWTLQTENKKGMDNRTEGTPMTIDANYTVGFTFGRQYGFRATKNFDNKFWLGVAVEDAQINAITAHGSAANFLALIAGNNGGLFNTLNNYSINASPDFVVKAALEPGWGHYEVYGTVGTFRTRMFPCAVGISPANPCSIDGSIANSAVGANNQTVTIGGVGANARLPFFAKKLDVIVNAFYGEGTGRYGVGNIADATVHPDGTPEPIRNARAMVGFEAHPTPSWDFYAYGGGEYGARTWYFTSAAQTATQGYGSPFFNNAGCFTEVTPAAGGLPGSQPGSCTGDTRAVFEGTVGFWHRFYQGPKGRLQFGVQYSYIERVAWSGCPAALEGGTCATSISTPSGPDNMVMTSFRYYIP